MAEDKNSIIVYADWIDKFEDLTDEEAGKLIKHFFRYVNDLEPVLEDRLLKMAFQDIQKSLKRDLKKWEQKKGERSESGVLGNLKRWHIDLYDKHVSGQITLEMALKIAETRKTSLSDNSDNKKSQTSLLTVSVNVNDINNIMGFFNFSEFANADKFRSCNDFLRCITINGNYEGFMTQFEAYKELKKRNPKYTHAFKNFIGTQKELFTDGAWNMENWQHKLNILKQEEKPKLSPSQLRKVHD